MAPWPSSAIPRNGRCSSRTRPAAPSRRRRSACAMIRRSNRSSALRRRMWSCGARSCAKTTACGGLFPPPTVIPRCLRIRRPLTSRGIRTHMWRLDLGSITALERPWPAWRVRRPSKPWRSGSPPCMWRRRSWNTSPASTFARSHLCLWPGRRWHMHQQFKVLDSDIHIIEPPDLWQRYIDAEFRDQAPYGLTEDAGDLRLAFDGKPWGRVAGAADASRRRQGHDYAHNQERWRPFQERGWTSKVQLEAMDMEGIDVAVIYPSRGLFALTIPGMEPRFAAAMARAYNHWLYDFCDETPAQYVIDAIGDDRLVFSTDLPHGDSEFPPAVQSVLHL